MEPPGEPEVNEKRALFPSPLLVSLSAVRVREGEGKGSGGGGGQYEVSTRRFLHETKTGPPRSRRAGGPWHVNFGTHINIGVPPGNVTLAGAEPCAPVFKPSCLSRFF